MWCVAALFVYKFKNFNMHITIKKKLDVKLTRSCVKCATTRGVMNPAVVPAVLMIPYRVAA